MIRILFRLYIFWLFFFFIFRILFILHQVYNKVTVTFSETIRAAFHGLKLDISATSYILIIPLLLLSAYYIVRREPLKRAVFIYHYILIPVCVLLMLANFAVYHAWGVLLNRRAVTFAAEPVEMMASLTTMQLISGILAFIILSALFIRLLHKTASVSVYSGSKKILRIAEILFLIALMVTGIRGGWQLIPVNESAAYFSPRPVLNDAATNPLWHLMNNLSKSAISDKNIYAGMSDKEASYLFKHLYATDPCNTPVLTGQRPNIVLILLESFTADIIEPLGGEKNITPFFTSLCDSGLLFTNIYASGRRTDQALPSVFSGFPAQPEYSVTRFTEKSAALPFMPRYLKQQGYHLSFYYGGELAFANMRSFLLTGGFEKITGKDDYPSSSMNSKWGAHDEFVLARQLSDLKDEKEPFFSALLTLTSHEPFEIPVEDYIKGNGDANHFRNAARYTDHCLKDYFTASAKQSWFDNTLFILVADHGHNLPLHRDYYDVKSHRIPLLLFGPALKAEFKGKKINGTGSQHDIAKTLLHQLHINAAPFEFSTDLLDTCRNSFAYIDLDQSLGWITDSGSFTYDRLTRKPERIIGNPPNALTLKSAVAYRQELYRVFLQLGK